MSHKKPYKHKRKGKARFVQLHHWVQDSDAWRSLKPGSRALYFELKRRYNGSNNGKIILSHRDAAEALNVHRNTVGPWFKDLEERGFIWKTQGPCLGPSGVGQAAHWALSEESTPDGKPARKTFMKWKGKQNPRTKNRTPRHNHCDADEENNAPKPSAVLKIVT